MTTPHPRHLFRRDGLLGTVIDVTIAGAANPDRPASACFEEIERLQRIFDVFDGASELRRWLRGEIEPGPDLADVVELADRWRIRSGGAFDPAVDALTALWDHAGSVGEPPDADLIAMTLDDVRCGRSRRWSLNGIAKGWIVDRAARCAVDEGAVHGVIVNAGGDLVALGPVPVTVGIEDPRRRFDNVPPSARVVLSNGALATSGPSRRGWSIGGTWYGHVIDPRRGRPVGHVESASVMAADCVTADVVATVLTVLSVADGVEFADEIGVACRIVDCEGAVHRNDGWRAAEPATHHPTRRSQTEPGPDSGGLHTATTDHPTSQEPSHADR